MAKGPGKRINNETTDHISEREQMVRIFQKQTQAYPQPYVTCSSENMRDKRFGLTSEKTTIGRADDCHIILEDLSVSGLHAIICAEAGDYYIQDEKSKNGTFLNDKRVQRAKLANGDFIRLGKSSMKVYLPEVK